MPDRSGIRSVFVLSQQPEKKVITMNQTMRKYAVIGCEHWHIVDFIKEMNALGFECAGIYEPANMRMAQSISSQFNIPIIDDREKLLSRDVEIVGCAAINSEKIDVIELCEQYGKHIMLTKPAVINRAGYDRLQKVIQRGRIQVGMLLQERIGRAETTLRRLLDEGMLGSVISIMTRKPHRLAAETRPSWFFDKAKNGGIIIDLAVHEFDLIRWMTGSEITQTQGYMAKNILPEYPTFYDAAALQATLACGAIAAMYVDWHTAEQSWTWGDCRIFVTGTIGTAELRLAGDPFIAHHPLLLVTTHAHGLRQLPCDEVFYTLSADLVARIDGSSATRLNHADILAASLAVIEADEAATAVDRCSSR
jgi:predicted dehydrogenase